MKKGKIEIQGSPDEVFTKANIKKVFDVECEVAKHPKTNRPLIIF